MMQVADWLLDGTVIFGIFLCLLIITWDLYFYFKVNETEKWAKIIYVGVGIGWLIRFILYFFNYDSLGIDKVNPPLLMLAIFTLLGFAVGAIIRVKRSVGFTVIASDLDALRKKIILWTSRK